MTDLTAAFHCHGPSAQLRGTAVTTEELSDCVTVRLGIGGDLPTLTIYCDRPAEAFAIAQAFARAGEILERRYAVSRRNELAAEPWADVPLPLDEDIAAEMGGDEVHRADVRAAVELCDCGKPAAHILADPDSAEWSCRVPPAGAAGALREAAWPPYALVDLGGSGE